MIHYENKETHNSFNQDVSKLPIKHSSSQTLQTQRHTSLCKSDNTVLKEQQMKSWQI